MYVCMINIIVYIEIDFFFLIIFPTEKRITTQIIGILYYVLKVSLLPIEQGTSFKKYLQRIYLNKSGNGGFHFA